jgi:hypothetical protein
MKASTHLVKNAPLMDLSGIKTHEVRLIVEGLIRMRNEMNERICEDDEKTIDVERFIAKDYQSKNLRNCLLVKNNIDELINTIQNQNHVPIIEP